VIVHLLGRYQTPFPDDGKRTNAKTASIPGRERKTHGAGVSRVGTKPWRPSKGLKPGQNHIVFYVSSGLIISHAPMRAA
jgi:hypothetical protein